MIEEIFSVDWDHVRLRRALSGVFAIVFVFAFISLAESFVLVAVVATLFNIAAAGDGPMRLRWRPMVRFTIMGAVVGGLAFASLDNAFAAAAVLTLATYLGTLGAAFGQRPARAGLFLTMWTVVALVLGTSETSPLVASMAFLVGGLVALAITAVRLAIAREDPADDESTMVGEVEPGDVAPVGTLFSRIRWASRGAVGEFALIRAFAVGLATVAGFWLFPGFEFWTSVTAIAVMRPSPHQTVSIAVQRTLGTAVGSVVAVMAVQAFPDSGIYAVLGFAVSAFFMVAFMNANYTLFAVFLTSTIVFGLRLAAADAFGGGIERGLATLLGAVIGLVAIVLAARFHSVPPESDAGVTPS